MDTLSKRIEEMQVRINAITEQRNEVMEKCIAAKKHLSALVDHWDEYSHNRMRMEITAVIEAIL